MKNLRARKKKHSRRDDVSGGDKMTTRIEEVSIRALEDIKRNMEFLVSPLIYKLSSTWQIANNALNAIDEIRRQKTPSL